MIPPGPKPVEPRTAVRRRRPYRRRVVLVAAVLALIAGALGAWSERAAARQRYVDRLAAHVDTCRRAHRVSSSAWWRLAPSERQLVALALLADGTIVWDVSLDEAWVVDLLAGILLTNRRAECRVAAARALGEMASRTAAEADDLPPGLDLAANALLAAEERDASPTVRCAAAAAALRIRPLARRYGLGQP